MFHVKRWVVEQIERTCAILDNIPRYEEGRWWRHGTWGCKWGLMEWADRLDQKWGTGVWK